MRPASVSPFARIAGSLALSIAWGAFGGGCSQRPPPAAPAAVLARFPVGSVPSFQHGVSVALGAAGCAVSFAPSAIVQTTTTPEGRAETRLRGAGRFRGGCRPPFTDLLFESVPVAAATITWNGSTPSPQLPNAPGSGQTLAVRGLDAARQDFHAVGPEGRWKLTAGCESVVRATPAMRLGADGTYGPADLFELSPVGAGTCRVEVLYLGARAEVTVTVTDAVAPAAPSP